MRSHTSSECSSSSDASSFMPAACLASGDECPISMSPSISRKRMDSVPPSGSGDTIASPPTQQDNFWAKGSRNNKRLPAVVDVVAQQQGRRRVSSLLPRAWKIKALNHKKPPTIGGRSSSLTPSDSNLRAGSMSESTSASIQSNTKFKKSSRSGAVRRGCMVKMIPYSLYDIDPMEVIASSFLSPCEIPHAGPTTPFRPSADSHFVSIFQKFCPGTRQSAKVSLYYTQEAVRRR